MEPTYDVVRFFRDWEDGNGMLIDSGLTLEEAQAHCSDPESSSVTATSESGKRLTDARGPWFDGYGIER